MLSSEIYDYPPLFDNSKLLDRDGGGLAPSQAAAEEQSQDGAVPKRPDGSSAGNLQEPLDVLLCEPMSEPDAAATDSLHASDGGGNPGIEEIIVGGFERPACVPRPASD